MRPMTIWGKISPWKIMTVSRRLKIRRERRRRDKWDLYHAIDRLPERYRSVVIMKYFDDMKISEIAQNPGHTGGNGKSLFKPGQKRTAPLFKRRLSGRIISMQINREQIPVPDRLDEVIKEKMDVLRREQRMRRLRKATVGVEPLQPVLWECWP